jgi:hypothetical protein
LHRLAAVRPRPASPIFQGDLIVPQRVRAPQPAFSAALIAYVEAHGEDDTIKNELCRTVPFPTRCTSTWSATWPTWRTGSAGEKTRR